jgi:hypothetical protein
MWGYLPAAGQKLEEKKRKKFNTQMNASCTSRE